MENEKYKILCVEKGLKKEAIIELVEDNDIVGIKFSLDRFVIEKKGENYFETLIELRKNLEIMDIKLLCKGCCRNVYPSGMMLSMGVGRKAYTLDYGKQAKTSSLVDIFDSCSIEEYATIDQQKDFFENWLKSITG